MKSANLPLRKALFASLNTNVVVNTISIPLYYNYAPNNTNGNYIVFSIPTQREIGSSCTNSCAVSVQFKIYGSEIAGNTGVTVDLIAEKLYELIYTSKTTLLELDVPFNHYGINFVSDTIANKVDVGNYVYIDRIITFEYLVSSTN